MTEPSLLEAWLLRYEKIAYRNQHLLEKFSGLLYSLGRRNIEILPLKGMDLILRGCSSPGQRPLTDVDILVHEKDLSKLVEYLEAHGFSRRKSGRGFLTDSFADESLDYISSETSLHLDIIWKVWYVESPEALWKRTVFRQTPIGACRLLHPRDSLLYRIAHAVAWNRYRSSFFVQDLQGLLQKEGGHIDWRQWVREIRQFGMAGVAFCGLAYARKEGLKEIPKEALAALRPRSFSERLLALYHSKATRDKTMLSSYLSPFLARPGWRKKGKFLKCVFFPSASWVALRRGKQSFWMLFLVGIFRPIRILVRMFYFIPRDLIKISLPRREQRKESVAEYWKKHADKRRENRE